MGLRESLQDNISMDKKFLNIFPATNSFMLHFWEFLCLFGGFLVSTPAAKGARNFVPKNVPVIATFNCISLNGVGI